MKKSFMLTGLLLLLGLPTIIAQEPALSGNSSVENTIHVTIIYDNYQHDPELETDWGFACLVEYQGKKLLFDAGRKAELYRKNIKLLDIHPENIPTLFISHEHGDHTAGMPWIIEMNPSVKCYLPASYAEQLKARGTLPPNSKGLAEPTHLYGPFYSTGDNFVAFREHGLVIKTEDGGVLITGCGHPGAVPMVTVAEEELGIEIHTLIGGLHLMNKSSEELEQLAATLKEMGVKQICPTHCTGDKSIASLKASFGEGYISGGTGKEIIIQ
ncbi:MAG: MBL fold metallo-hydrolase [Bacteroidota bacterium]|nr:MBL fold metallo-hydrolase [Bacteroidota bacterium]